MYADLPIESKNKKRRKLLKSTDECSSTVFGDRVNKLYQSLVVMDQNNSRKTNIDSIEPEIPLAGYPYHKLKQEGSLLMNAARSA